MARTKRWTWKDLGSGVTEVSISSWKYFGDFVYQEMLDYNSYVWRGQRCDDWKLESTLDRLVRNAKVPSARALKFRDAHLDQFKYAARGRRGLNPPLCLVGSRSTSWTGNPTPRLDNVTLCCGIFCIY